MTYEMTNALGFEIKTCTRCHGSGQYSFNQIDGSKCYGCSGCGKQYTGRGKLVKRFWDELCQIDPADVVVGQRIDNGMAKFTVAEVLPVTESGAVIKDGVRIPMMFHNFKSVSGKEYSAQAGYKVRLIPQGEERERLLAQALAYQDSLTKEGKPRKAAKQAA
jgi:hypothetical protein